MLLRTIIPEHIKGLKYYTYSHILLDDMYPFYIGLGTNSDKVKYGRAKTKSGRNKFWRNITKNKDYICIISSESDSYDQIKLHEIDVISILGKRIEDDEGYLVNITDGGEGCLGYKHTKEHIEWLKERYSGENNPMFGKKASENTRMKMSKSQTGRVCSEDTKHLLRIKKLERGYQGKYGKEHGRARAVYQLNSLTYEIIKRFDIIKDAARMMNVSDKVIGKACKEYFRVKGFNWSYTDNYSVEKFINNTKIYKKDLYKDTVCKDFKEGLTIASIARKYNIGETTCSRILKNNISI